jgi:ParB-like chromosome segregation protein Spo0J
MKTEAVVNDGSYLPKVVNQIVEVDPKILIEDENNPNTMPLKKLKRLAEVIRKYGFVYPIIIDTKGKIIDGHQRAKAAEILGIKPPALVIDTAESDVDKKFLRQWFNKFRGEHDVEMDITEIEALFADEAGAVMMEDFMDFTGKDLEKLKETVDDFEELSEEDPITDKKRRIILFFTSPDYDFARKKLDALSKKYGTIDDSRTILELLAKS